MTKTADTSSWAGAEAKAARALEANKRRISSTKRGTSSSTTLAARARRKARPKL